MASGRCLADRDRAAAHPHSRSRPGITCWDENALAETRRYAQLSPAVGLIVLRTAARAWAGAASEAPAEAVVRHPQFGDLGALEIIRRNAYEAHHHLMDINRYRDL